MSKKSKGKTFLPFERKDRRDKQAVIVSFPLGTLTEDADKKIAIDSRSANIGHEKASASPFGANQLVFLEDTSASVGLQPIQ